MAGGWPIRDRFANATDLGSVTASSRGTALTTGAANTKGSYTQLVASTTIDAAWMVVTLDNKPSAGAELAVDIAVGASGSEVVITPNLVMMNNYAVGPRYSFPVKIPAGSRVAARAQSISATDTVNVQVTLFDGAFEQAEASATVDVYGFNAGTTLGTSVDPGATANTKGAYSQLTASTSADMSGFVLAIDVLGQVLGTVASSYQYLMDIAIGASGSEQVILPNSVLRSVRAQTTGVNTMHPITTEFIPLFIPAGTRVAVRAQCSINTATARLFGLTLYGVRA